MIPKFEIGFWHPFGPHAGETAEEILARKNDEINNNPEHWTLWSFQFRNSLNSWYQEINKVNPDNVLVFCSMGVGAKDPKQEPSKCGYYLPVNELASKVIPKEISVPHPMKTGGRGSAFIVKEIIYPADFKPVNIKWLRNDGWQISTLPTRPEYLIKPDKSGVLMRDVRAILVLKRPYLATVGII